MKKLLTTLFLLVAVVAIGRWYASPGSDPEKDAARAFRQSQLLTKEDRNPDRTPPESARRELEDARILQMGGADWQKHFADSAVGLGQRAALREEIASLAEEWQNLRSEHEGEEKPDARDYLEVMDILLTELGRSRAPLGPDMTTLPDWE